MKALALTVLAACGSDSPTSLTVSTAFTPNTMFGMGPSYLEKYVGQELSFVVEFPSFGRTTYMDSVDCANSDLHSKNATRTALGANAADAQRELLDPLDGTWELALEWCDDPSRSTLTLDSVIDPYNLSFGCGAVPADAQPFDDGGNPIIASTTVMRCNATILDVVAAFTIGNADFTMTVEAR